MRLRCLEKSRFLFLIGIVVSISSCKYQKYNDIGQPDTSLRLLWNKAYETETSEESLIGLQWALSYLGARLPKSDPGIVIQDSLFIIELNKIGLDRGGVDQMLRLHDVIKNSQEYEITGAIDLGRYISLLLSSPEHYYAVTGMPRTLDELVANYTLESNEGLVTNSGVSLEHRIIRYSAQNGFHQLFLSVEIDSITKDTLEYETVDILPNGQPRFGIFDTDRRRKNFADPKHSRGGKPSKCIWCHESGIQPMFRKQRDGADFLTYQQFQDTLWKFKRAHHVAQLALENGVSYGEKQQHTLTELQYISFMEPSAERLSSEWKMPVTKVRELLFDLDTHIHHEFPFLGELYTRKDVEPFAPFQGLPVAGSVREPSDSEINYMIRND